ncbi:hypothetical protein PRZ48_010573 [Zasmidium cellare]|uniref:Uncharacterized protein n=1 Tax=Zasmidium cellare TaxID=395010 RepID=A0ABR0E9H4_ZASCE|nr:hypothetical protein PRZ48_010573 [Zasmidium cellare]
MSESQATFEPDMDAFWESWDKQQAWKKKKEAIHEAWRKTQRDKMDSSKRTFYLEMQESLPARLKFKEDQNLYPEYLPVDKQKSFPLEKVYGGKQAYRGGDRPRFKKANGRALTPGDRTSALIVLSDPKADGELVAFGYPFRAIQRDFAEDPAASHRRNPANDNETHKQPAGDVDDSSSEDGDDEIRPKNEDKPLSLEEEEEQSKELKFTGEHQTKLSMDVDQDPSQPSGASPEDHSTDVGKLNPKWIKVMFKPDSQRPRVRLVFHLDRGTNEREVAIDIYGQHLMATEDSIGIEMSTTKQSRVLQGLPNGEELELLDRNLATLAKDDSLWRTDVHLTKPGSYEIMGVTQEEATAIRKKDSSQLNDGERLLNALSVNRVLSIFVQAPSSEHTALQPFFEYFATVMYAAAHLGNFWWYALVTNGERDAIQQSDYPFNQVPVPRWMIKRWRIECYGDWIYAEPRSAQAQECAQYKTATEGRNPGLDDYVDVQRFVVAREAQGSLVEFEKLSSTKPKTTDSADHEPAEQEKGEEPNKRPVGRGKPPGTGKRSQGRGRGSSGARGGLGRGNGGRGHGARGSGGRGNWGGNRRGGGFFSAAG